MKYNIDIASLQDTETIVNFQLLMAKESENTELDYETVREGVKAAIEDDNKAVYLLAKKDNVVLGSMMLTVEWSDWNNAPYYWMQSVYVRPEDRRKGVFTELFEFARTLAESEHAGALRLYVDKNNTVAQHVYKALGMHDSNYFLYEL
nr:GNAT family N-acetyltransferase [Prevotella sp.]